MEQVNIAIIGGGAAGLCCAVQLAKAGVNGVAVWEKAPRVGRKLMATGNGTCNITNRDLSLAHYHGQNPAFAKAALERFSYADTLAFFGGIGVDCVTDPDGRAYPRSRQASAVLDCLRLEAEAGGVTFYTGCPVTAITKVNDGFKLTTADGTTVARRVIIAAGGAASPSLGGCNDGYTLLTSLGHSRTPLFPTIVQLRTDIAFVKAVKGIRVDGTITLKNGKETLSSSGEILFTEYGLSGPAVMAISRMVGNWERRKKGDLTAHLDLLPDLSAEDVTAILQKRRNLAERECGEYLTGFVNKRVGQTVLRMAGVSLNAPVSSLTDTDIAAVAALLKDWTLSVSGTQGFGSAQATAGGIATDEFDPVTLQSRLHKGLYAIGEVLDIDGDCGGYNLQWAWSSAAAAARDITNLQK